MKRIGITGGIGSGKSTVCEIFGILNIPIYDADREAKRIMTKDPKVKNAIKSLLGESSYHSNGRVNRSFVSSQIFNDKSKLQGINAIVHPAVHQDSEKWFSYYSTLSNIPFCLYEAALIVENKSYHSFDGLIVVTCPEEIRIERVLKRDGLPRQAVQAKIKNQLPESEKITVADYIIINDGLTNLTQQVLNIYRQICNEQN